MKWGVWWCSRQSIFKISAEVGWALSSMGFARGRFLDGCRESCSKTIFFTEYILFIDPSGTCIWHVSPGIISTMVLGIFCFHGAKVYDVRQFMYFLYYLCIAVVPFSWLGSSHFYISGRCPKSSYHRWHWWGVIVARIIHKRWCRNTNSKVYWNSCSFLAVTKH